jgi:hypothetical protein
MEEELLSMILDSSGYPIVKLYDNTNKDGYYWEYASV